MAITTECAHVGIAEQSRVPAGSIPVGIGDNFGGRGSIRVGIGPWLLLEF